MDHTDQRDGGVGTLTAAKSPPAGEKREQMIHSSSPQQTFWEQKAASRWGQYLSEMESAALREALSRFRSPGAALEVGCEGGRWSKLLADAGWTLTCTDINAEMLRVCQQRIPHARCILSNTNDQRLPVEDQSVDLLVSIQVPVVEEPWFASEVARVLRPGGVAVCTFNNRRSYRGKLVNIRSALHGWEPFYIADYETCRQRFVEAGFSFCRETGYAWFPFSRGSNSRLIPLFVGLERSLGLRRLVRFSPWVAVVAEPLRN